MGILESKPSQQTTPSPTTTTSAQDESQGAASQSDQQFRDDVRRSAENFKNLVLNNKVMIFSATYCSYCTVAKVSLVVSSNLVVELTKIIFSCRRHWMSSAHNSKAWRWTRLARTGSGWWTSWRPWRGRGWCPPSSSVVSWCPGAGPASSTWPPPVSCPTS